MKQFFILGRNPELSRAEIRSYLEARSVQVQEAHFNEHILIIEFNRNAPVQIQKLGGTLHSGTLLFEGTKEALETYLEQEELVPTDKFSYSTFGNEDYTLLGEKFKQEKRKAMYKPGSKLLATQGGEPIHFSKTDYTFILEQSEGTYYFGIIEQTFKPEGLAERDMNKPIRREELAISPRLSRILLNLAGGRTGTEIADPFCGIGAILLEGLALGMNVYGRDKDTKAIKGAKQNLQWYINTHGSRGRYHVERGNSKELPQNNFEGIAGEGPLGTLLNKKASKKEAKQMIETFERTIIPILTRFKTCVKKKGKIALTFPVVGDYRVNCKAVAEAAGIHIVQGPIREYREKQKVSRDIIIFQA